MGRKKKSNNHSTSSITSPLSKTKADRHDSKVDGTTKNKAKQLLKLKLIQQQQNQSAKSTTLDPQPKIFLSEFDAHELDVIQDDSILAISINENNSDNKGTVSIRSVAMCAVRISTSTVTKGKLLSTPSPKKSSSSGGNSNSSSNIRVSQGSCRIFPLALAERLCGNKTATTTTTGNNSDNCQLTNTADAIKTPSPQQSLSNKDVGITSTPNKTPSSSSSKSKFSFARGGGGDAFISPQSQQKSLSTPQQTPSKVSFSHTWIVPIRSKNYSKSSDNFGMQLSKMLCQSAASILIKPTSNNTVSIHNLGKNSLRIMARLVLASSIGRYVSKKDILRSSFRGQSIEWEIQSITSEIKNASDTGMSWTSDAFASMNLKDTTENANDNDDDGSATNDMDGADILLDALKSTIVTTTATANNKIYENLCIFEITHNTEIRITESNDEEQQQQRSSTHVDSSTQDTTIERQVVVAGLDDTLENIKSLLLPPLIRPELFLEGSLKPPRGVLLHGPSGVGKSALAKQIAIDFEHMGGIRVQTVNCTTLQSHTAIVGEAERMLTRLFQSASSGAGEQQKGTLLILDDVHLICPKRGGGNAGVDRLSATLLALLDGVGGGPSNEKRSNVVILAITSNPSLLDSALRRPGRLDTEVEVPIPDEVTRGQILQFQLHTVGQSATLPSLSDKDLTDLARLAKGFNGADCMLAMKEALRTAIVRSQTIESLQIDDPSGLALPDVKLTMNDVKSAIRSTKPSTIKSITVEIPQVHWSSIGGMNSVKQMLKEAIELPLTHAHLFEALHIPPPRGVLLYGPPGCSKTLMARALATEGHMNFLAVKGPELLSKWLGESERALASLFRRARMASPCIIFFDEIDAIATKRGSSGGNSGGERLLSQLLTELDGVSNPGSTLVSGDKKKNQRVIVVGATNRPDLLDSALMRPGRIDRMIYVGLPDTPSRQQILEIGLKGKNFSDDVDIPLLANEKYTGGFSGAEMISICREAALYAIEEEDTNDFGIDTTDMESARLQLKNLSLSPTYLSSPRQAQQAIKRKQKINAARFSSSTPTNHPVPKLSPSPDGIKSNNTTGPQICMRHLLRAIEGTKRQITPEMLDFYASFQNRSTAQ